MYPRIIGYGVDDISVSERIVSRLIDLNNYQLFFSYLVLNEKFIFSLLIFSFVFFKKFKKNKSLFTFVLLAVVPYYILLYFVFLIASWDLNMTLNSSAHRVLISIVLTLTFFSIYSYRKEKNLNL